jgi:hypothetical protein
VLAQTRIASSRQQRQPTRSTAPADARPPTAERNAA